MFALTVNTLDMLVRMCFTKVIGLIYSPTAIIRHAKIWNTILLLALFKI